MRRAPPPGTSATLRIRVSEDMAAGFDDELVHPVYGTAALVRHLEQVARRLLRPLLEEGEEGVGARLEIRHLAPVPIGEEVEVEARVRGSGERSLVTDVVARWGERTVAVGVFEQAVVPLEEWRRRAGFGA